MKELLQQYAVYNQWANDRILSTAETLSNEQLHQEITSSFKSVWLTIFHIWATETVWWNRLQKGPNIIAMDDPFDGDITVMANAIRKQDQQWVHFVSNLAESAFRENLSYQNIKGDPFTQEIYLLLQHIFNHSTYHRGQLITLLRQAGATTVPNTDFIAWSRIPK